MKPSEKIACNALYIMNENQCPLCYSLSLEGLLGNLLPFPSQHFTGTYQPLNLTSGSVQSLSSLESISLGKAVLKAWYLTICASRFHQWCLDIFPTELTSSSMCVLSTHPFNTMDHLKRACSLETLGIKQLLKCPPKYFLRITKICCLLHPKQPTT